MGVKERLDKYLATRQNLTRSQAREIIRRGGSAVNGRPVRDPGTQVDPENDAVTLHGAPVGGGAFSYLMLHKPAGYVSATEDAGPTVLELVPPELRRKGQFPAGRLDKDTEGFVLITDDGAFAHRILAPRSHLPKTYYVELDGPVGEEDVRAFAEGMTLGGQRLHPALLTVLGPADHAEVVLTQGLYPQIKRMFQARGRKVVYLKRTKIGGLALDPALPKGGCRALTQEELALLRAEKQPAAQTSGENAP